MLQKLLCLPGVVKTMLVGSCFSFFVGTIIGFRFSLVYLNDNPPLSYSLSIFLKKNSWIASWAQILSIDNFVTSLIYVRHFSFDFTMGSVSIITFFFKNSFHNQSLAHEH